MAASDDEGGVVYAEQAGAVRYARQRAAVVRRLLDGDALPGNPRRQLEQRRPVLPGGEPRRVRAVVPLRLPRLPPRPSSFRAVGREQARRTAPAGGGRRSGV